MNPSKGARQEVKLRLSPEVVERLNAYKVAHGLDGLPAVVTEWSALRGDRDQELEAARAEAKAMRALYNTALMVNADQARELKNLRRRGAKRAIRERAPPQVALAYVVESVKCPCGGALDRFSIGSGLCRPCRDAKVAALQTLEVSS